MKRFFAAAITTAILPFAAIADVRSDAKEALTMWQPTSVAFEGGTLTVVLPQQRITEEIYTAVMTAGLCLWSAAGKDFSPVTELVVLNQHQRQGYVNENGTQDCAAINKLPVGGTGVKLQILGATHTY